MCWLSIWRIKHPFEEKLALVQSGHYVLSQKHGPGRGESTVKADKGGKIAWGGGSKHQGGSGPEA